MRTKRLGRTPIEISSIVFGGWQAGKADWVGIDDASSIAAHRAAFDRGITTFDTAEAYGDGHSERILAEALGAQRDRIVIASKVSWKHLRREQVKRACERSLRNLHTDRIDLYQIHWPAGSFGSERVPLEETMGALLDLKQEGKILAIGVSNFSRDELAAAMDIGRVDSLQPAYSLFWRHVERDAMPLCVEKDITLLAYSPLAQGLLTGKLGPGHVLKPGDNRADNKLFQGENYRRAQETVERLRPIAKRYEITLGQLALAWLTAQPIVAAIVGARDAKQATENAAAGGVTLAEDDLRTIEAIGRAVTDPLANEGPVMWKWDV